MGKRFRFFKFALLELDKYPAKVDNLKVNILMYELNASDLCLVSGGYSVTELVYVTQEWKDTRALCAGLIEGFTGMLVGGILGGIYAVNPFIGLSLGMSIGGGIGFGLGYGFSTLETYTLENDTYHTHVISPHYDVFQ